MLRALTLALSLIPLPVLAETVEIETFAGPETVTRNPAKVVVLDIPALDTLDALGSARMAWSIISTCPTLTKAMPWLSAPFSNPTTKRWPPWRLT